MPFGRHSYTYEIVFDADLNERNHIENVTGSRGSYWASVFPHIVLTQNVCRYKKKNPCSKVRTRGKMNK